MKDISLVLCGEAGQGIQTIENLLKRITSSSGFHVFAVSEFMSRIRGGSNSTEIRIASNRVRAFVDRIDVFVPLSSKAFGHVQERLSPDTLILGEIEKPGYNCVTVPYASTARELGNPVYANSVALGVLCSILDIPDEILYGMLRSTFARKANGVVTKNLQAAQKGYSIGRHIVVSGKFLSNIQTNNDTAMEVIMDGSEAIALGAIAGGCNFIAAYPMTPAAGVWTYLAQHAHEFGIVTEQAEDEISAMNMAVGAWYAGARALVSTSGGGFDLMTEGLSLVGAQESPMVIHLAQRPGPATGLPTRTEQADLELALHAGHGEFPRIILAPGKIEDALFITQKAFNLADQYQVPVIILTDQYFVDSSYNIPRPDIKRLGVESHIVKTDMDYRRYRITENGISPRGIPGHGEGFVCADCHVHDEQGHISEDLKLRTKMVDKAFRKGKSLIRDFAVPELYGSRDYRHLVICWGSNYNPVKEAIDSLGRDDIALLHFSWVWPLGPEVGSYFKSNPNIIAVENNATGQFAKLLGSNLGIDISKRLLKYNGLPFAVEEIAAGLKEMT